MDLVDEELPTLTLRPEVAPSVCLDRCEAVAEEKGYAIDRRRDYAGPGYDLLNLHLGGSVGSPPMIRMVSTPRMGDRLALDTVDDRVSLTYDSYVPAAKAAYRRFLRDSADKFHKHLRVGVPRRRPRFDLASANLASVSYARETFAHAIRAMAVGKGDVRDRLISAFMLVHVVRPEELPEPLLSLA